MTNTATSPASKAASSKAAGKKAPAKKAAPKPELSDMTTSADIIQISTSIETLEKDKALSQISDLIESVETSYFALGGVLARVQEENWWKDEGFDTFKAFLAEKYGYAYRKAMYLIQIYKDVVNAGVKPEQVAKLGWTKLKEISHLLTLDNVEEWVKKADEMTVMQLVAYVKALKDNPGDKKAASTASSNVVSKTFKLHTDQREIIDTALQKKMADQGTDVETVALTSICEEFLSETKTDGISVELFKKLGFEKVLECFGEAFPNIDLEVAVPDDE